MQASPTPTLGAQARGLAAGAFALAAGLIGPTLLLPPTAEAQGRAQIVTHETLPAIPKELEPVREALARYRDYNVAEGEIFVAIGCVDYGVDNGVGKTYSGQDVEQVMLNYMLTTSSEPDPLQPSGLVYARTPSGPLRLAAAIWTVPFEKGKPRPKLFGQEFTGPVIIDGETPLQRVNLDQYELFAWLWDENPRGLFARTNPALPCVSDGYSIKAKFHEETND